MIILSAFICTKYKPSFLLLLGLAINKAVSLWILNFGYELNLPESSSLYLPDLDLKINVKSDSVYR